MYGFVTLPFELLFDVIEHPYFQRLRRIKQLGLTHYVYPGALHTRFHHALGAVHLMTQAIDVLRSKGQSITDDEAEAANLAILLHDIGHGPYSHALENCLVTNISHEHLSKMIISELEKEYGNSLSLALDIFQDRYEKKFLHQLISSQLDVDRLDYLNRDSFFTGVYEGVIGYDRIIKMMTIHNDELMIEAKGIYSIEKFIIARRLMYWQVYLHKTVLGAEQLLAKIIKRAKYLSRQGVELFATPWLQLFLKNNYTLDDFQSDPGLIRQFARVDDYDVLTSIKVWTQHEDKVLSILSQGLIDRHLLKVELQNEPIETEKLQQYRDKAMQRYGITDEEAGYLVFDDSTSNSAYSIAEGNINILFKSGEVSDIVQASDQLNISVLTKPVVKYYLCYPKSLI